MFVTLRALPGTGPAGPKSSRGRLPSTVHHCSSSRSAALKCPSSPSHTTSTMLCRAKLAVRLCSRRYSTAVNPYSNFQKLRGKVSNGSVAPLTLTGHGSISLCVRPGNGQVLLGPLGLCTMQQGSLCLGSCALHPWFPGECLPTETDSAGLFPSVDIRRGAAGRH